MRIGIVGFQGSGKSTLFEWISGIPAEPAHAHLGQSAMVPVPDPRMEPLCAIYHPKKITHASLELVDTPGLSRTHEGNASRLAVIRESGCLVVVVGAFQGADAAAELRRLDEDLLLADLSIVAGRVERLRESVKKPRPSRDQELAELAALEPLATSMESGQPVALTRLDETQEKALRSFGLLTQKPQLVVLNLADDDPAPEARAAEIAAAFDNRRCLALPVGLQLELQRMNDEDRSAIVAEMGLAVFDRGDVIREILAATGQTLFFTAGEKEVRSWLLHEKGTALDAAAGIHSDLARGFIRAEVMASADLIRLGSEREMKAQHLVRQEPKDYAVQDGDILLIKFSV
jgi:ribosome-binding ATPase YchF (GTP1/OBG family)